MSKKAASKSTTNTGDTKKATANPDTRKNLASVLTKRKQPSESLTLLAKISNKKKKHKKNPSSIETEVPIPVPVLPSPPPVPVVNGSTEMVPMGDDEDQQQSNYTLIETTIRPEAEVIYCATEEPIGNEQEAEAEVPVMEENEDITLVLVDPPNQHVPPPPPPMEEVVLPIPQPPCASCHQRTTTYCPHFPIGGGGNSQHILVAQLFAKLSLTYPPEKSSFNQLIEYFTQLYWLLLYGGRYVITSGTRSTEDGGKGDYVCKLQEPRSFPKANQVNEMTKVITNLITQWPLGVILVKPVPGPLAQPTVIRVDHVEPTKLATPSMVDDVTLNISNTPKATCFSFYSRNIIWAFEKTLFGPSGDGGNYHRAVKLAWFLWECACLYCHYSGFKYTKLTQLFPIICKTVCTLYNIPLPHGELGVIWHTVPRFLNAQFESPLGNNVKAWVSTVYFLLPAFDTISLSTKANNFVNLNQMLIQDRHIHGGQGAGAVLESNKYFDKDNLDHDDQLWKHELMQIYFNRLRSFLVKYTNALKTYAFNVAKQQQERQERSERQEPPTPMDLGTIELRAIASSPQVDYYYVSNVENDIYQNQSFLHLGVFGTAQTKGPGPGLSQSPENLGQDWWPYLFGLVGEGSSSSSDQDIQWWIPDSNLHSLFDYTMTHTGRVMSTCFSGIKAIDFIANLMVYGHGPGVLFKWFQSSYRDNYHAAWRNLTIGEYPYFNSGAGAGAGSGPIVRECKKTTPSSATEFGASWVIIANLSLMINHWLYVKKGTELPLLVTSSGGGGGGNIGTYCCFTKLALEYYGQLEYWAKKNIFFRLSKNSGGGGGAESLANSNNNTETCLYSVAQRSLHPVKWLLTNKKLYFLRDQEFELPLDYRHQATQEWQIYDGKHAIGYNASEAYPTRKSGAGSGGSGDSGEKVLLTFHLEHLRLESPLLIGTTTTTSDKEFTLPTFHNCYITDAYSFKDSIIYKEVFSWLFTRDGNELLKREVVIMANLFFAIFPPNMLSGKHPGHVSVHSSHFFTPSLNVVAYTERVLAAGGGGSNQRHSRSDLRTDLRPPDMGASNLHVPHYMEIKPPIKSAKVIWIDLPGNITSETHSLYLEQILTRFCEREDLLLQPSKNNGNNRSSSSSRGSSPSTTTNNHHSLIQLLPHPLYILFAKRLFLIAKKNSSSGVVNLETFRSVLEDLVGGTGTGGNSNSFHDEFVQTHARQIRFKKIPKADLLSDYINCFRNFFGTNNGNGDLGDLRKKEFPPLIVKSYPNIPVSIRDLVLVSYPEWTGLHTISSTTGVSLFIFGKNTLSNIMDCSLSFYQSTVGDSSSSATASPSSPTFWPWISFNTNCYILKFSYDTHGPSSHKLWTASGLTLIVGTGHMTPTTPPTDIQFVQLGLHTIPITERIFNKLLTNALLMVLPYQW